MIVDYVIENNLLLVQKVADEFSANFYYVVLTASEERIRQRIIQRGDVDMIDRALFLKNKLDNLSENQGFLFDNTGKSVEEIEMLDIGKFLTRT